MTGGVASVVHRLTVDCGGCREVLVLRQYEHGFLAHVGSETAALVRDEVATLRAVHDAGLPAPEPIAAASFTATSSTSTCSGGAAG
jgi:hypothetical protein